LHSLTLLYKSNKAYKAYADMFTKRADEIKALNAAEKEGEDE
jgi:hypothetical protein